MADRSDQPVIEIDNVFKTFDDGRRRVDVLHEISMTLYRGELNLLMGPSGSGKTTLLSIMGMLLKPTSGRIVIQGEDVTAMNEASLPALRRRHIGFVFQGYNLLSALSARENVEVTLDLQGIRGRKARSRAMELLEAVGLKERWQHLPEELSGGEKQRVAVARALATPASLIIADEPTGNLDSRTSGIIVDMISRIARKENRSVIVGTHDSSLRPLADRIIVLTDGRIDPELSVDNRDRPADEPAEPSREPAASV